MNALNEGFFFYFNSRDGPGTPSCMQSHHPHLRDLWLLGWLPCRWRKRKKNSASGKSRLCTKKNSYISKPKASFFAHTKYCFKMTFFIQFFPEYRRDDSFVNPHLLDHPLGAPLVNSNHTISSSSIFWLLLHIQTWNLYIYFVILAPFRFPAASFLFRAGWHMKNRCHYILIFSFRECPTYLTDLSGYLVSSVILNLINRPTLCNTSYKHTKLLNVLLHVRYLNVFWWLRVIIVQYIHWNCRRWWYLPVDTPTSSSQNGASRYLQCWKVLFLYVGFPFRTKPLLFTVRCFIKLTNWLLTSFIMAQLWKFIMSHICWLMHW